MSSAKKQKISKPKEPIDLVKIAEKVKLGNLRKEIKEFRKDAEK